MRDQRDRPPSIVRRLESLSLVDHNLFFSSNPYQTTMSYYIAKTTDLPFDEAIEHVTAALKEEGFGILTDIDIRATFKKKLDVDVPAYRILGACNPPFAYQALQAEDKIGTMLPCNVIVRDAGAGRVEIAAVDPIASMQAVETERLAGIAAEVRARLQRAVARV